MSLKFIKKKSLGQNFLKSKGILNIIVNSANIKPNDIILEIGPGKGVLTEKILEKNPKKLIIVEKDDRLIDFLNEKFKKQVKNGQLEIINQDILDFDINLEEKYKIIANIPYYITGQIIRKFLSTNNQPQLMVLMVQKEVAERIITKDKKESILSMSVKFYGKPEYIKTVKAKYFSPKPKVDSAILLINNISKDFFIDLNEERCFKILKIGFSHKRKFVLNNLKKYLPEIDWENIFEKEKINKKLRPENLSKNDWKKLFLNI